MADEIVTLTEELHRRLHVQARNLLFEYQLAAENRGMVPCEIVESLMRLYGGLIAKEIWGSLKQEGLLPGPASAPQPPIQVGDIIAFVAWAGHPITGRAVECFGRVERDARGLHAANYYEHAWKNPRILERSKAPDLKKIPC